jgi:NAD(P) transhydrogenase subunit beta
VLLTHLAYLVAASLFIVGLHYLRTPVTAPRGNLLAALGMLLAVVVTLLDSAILRYDLIIAGLLLGTGIGAAAARFVQMTAMPQMVGLFNGSMLVATAAYARLTGAAELLTASTMLLIGLGTVVGAVTFTGSLIAFGKLQDLLPGRQITFPLQHLVHVLVLLALLAAGGTLLLAPQQTAVFLVLLALALLFGVLFVLPIGAADMPVVISLLNACSGLAASITGFVVQNNLLIIAGALVGASGLILTQIMCRAMNRSLTNVLLGEFSADTGTASSEAGARPVHAIDPEEGAMVLAYAQQVIIVPGYGMAVAQAQHAVRELADLLEHRGVVVKYAIHPVAGRMPGHMNVLLAEANVPYPKLYDMDDINPEFEHTDVVLVIGANDIVNPAARSETASPIYGMPILDVDRARHIIVVKRSLRPGFAGIDNALFYHQKTMMLFGDARDVVTGLINEIKRL